VKIVRETGEDKRRGGGFIQNGRGGEKFHKAGLKAGDVHLGPGKKKENEKGGKR